MKQKLVSDFSYGIFFLLSLLIGGSDELSVITPCILIIYQIRQIYTFRNSIEILFLLIFSITYPIYWLASVLLSVEIHYLSSYVTPSNVAMAFSAQGLFLCSMFIGMQNRPPRIIASYKRRNSGSIFWLCILAMITCLAFAVLSVKGSILEQSYDYQSSESSILFEYVLILIIISYIFSGETKLRKYTLIISSISFVLAPLYFGKRLPASMIAFSILLIFWRPKGIKQVSAIFISGFLLLSIIALFRVGDSSQSLTGILFNIGEEGAMRNNQGGVVYSSAAYMKLVEEGFFDFYFSIKSISNLALSIFLPSSLVDEAAYINFSAMKFIPIPGNGGFPGVTFYIWGRELGVIIFGLFFGWVISRSRYSPLSAVYTTFLLFTFPRWMAYNVNIMFKAGLLLVVAYLLIELAINSSSLRPKDSLERP